MDDEVAVQFKEAVSLRELVSGGTQFEIKTNYENMDESFGMDDAIDESDDDVDSTVLMSPWTKPFNELRDLMKPVPDTNIYKRIVKEGSGEPITEQSQVTVHYNGFWEGQCEAFDSTDLRGQPKTFRILTDSSGGLDVLLGIHMAVETMRTGEESQFIIPYVYLFGELGCPPRIQPKADGLFIIRLLKSIPIGNENAGDCLGDEDRKKFKTVFPRAQQIRKAGSFHFKQGNIQRSIREFQKAIRALEFCNLTDMDEQHQQQTFLVGLYTNLAVCYIKLEKWKPASSMCNEIRQLLRGDVNCKVLFLEGKALTMLGDFKRARSLLNQAQDKEPSNTAISDALRVLDQRYKLYKDTEKRCWRNAFGLETSKSERKESCAESPVTIQTVSPEFHHNIRQILGNLIDNKLSSISLPDNIRPNELTYIKDLIVGLPVKLNVGGTSDGIVYSLEREIIKN